MIVTIAACMGDQIFQVRFIIPPAVKQRVDKMMGDKIFQEGPNISEILVPGGPNISAKLK